MTFRAVLTFGVGLAAACAGPQAEIPAGPATRAPVVHAVRVAIPPLADARSPDEAPDEDGRYVYGGRVYRGTNLDWLRPSAVEHVTRRFAEALSRTGLFSELVLVRKASDDPRADLVLRGAIRRARGYVQDRPEDGESVWALAEVVLDDLELVDARTGAVRFTGATGWSVHERRVEAEPWDVLAETLDRAVARLADVLADADLDSFVAAPSVSAPVVEPGADLFRLTPPGWRHTLTSSAATPRGWSGAARCAEDRFVQQQALRFHRVLGPYVPSVRVWSCPADVRLLWSARAELPAVLLGRDPGGRWMLASALGISNWPGALDELKARLGLEPVPEYVVEIDGTARALDRWPIPKPARSSNRSRRRPIRTEE